MTQHNRQYKDSVFVDFFSEDKTAKANFLSLYNALQEHGFEKAITECIKNDILRDYLQRKSREVMNMLIGEYDYNTDIAVQREESFEIGLAEGEARGRSEGSRQAKLETAKILKQLGDSVQKIAQATGLTQAEVEAIN